MKVTRQRAHRTPSGGNLNSAATPTLRQRDGESPSSQQSTSPPNFPVPVQGPPGLLINKFNHPENPPFFKTGTVQAHRRGGRPPPMRRANPGARPRRNRRRPTGTAPRATGSRTLPANQSRQHDPTINSPRRAGQAPGRPQPGAPPTTSGNRAATSATLATRKIPPLSPTVMRRNIAD